MTLVYTNPRLAAEIPDWPSGKDRVTAHFRIEQNHNGERACRRTTGAEKKLTYAKKMRIVDGSDGKTYIAALSFYGSMIAIYRGDMKFQEEIIHASGDPVRFLAVLNLINEGESK
jgi:hypothetical protein